MQQTSAEDYLDRAAQAAIMVCMACAKPTPPGRYTFKSNARGENLGGIFCSTACCDDMESCMDCSGSGVIYVMENGGPERKEPCGYCWGHGFARKPFTKGADSHNGLGQSPGNQVKEV